MILTLLLSGDVQNSIEPSPLWSITILYFLQVIAVIWLAIFAIRKLRTFEKRFFLTGMDHHLERTKRTFSKWKFCSMCAPDRLEDWLSQMAASGSRLVHVGQQAMRFTFQKDAPKMVSFVFDFQWKASPTYFDIHKSVGWKLLFTTPYPWMRYSLWMKEYREGEEKPQLVYDPMEEKARVRKLFWGNMVSFSFPIAIALLVLFTIVPSFHAEGWDWSQHFLIGALLFSLIMPISHISRTIAYRLRKG